MAGAYQRPVDPEPGRIAERFELAGCCFELHRNTGNLRNGDRQAIFPRQSKEVPAILF
jgi:hypothetical protein